MLCMPPEYMALLQVESRRWQRSAGYVARGATRAPVMAEEMDEDLIEEAAAGQAEFERMKTEYSLWTTGTVAVASAAVFVLCPRVRLSLTPCALQ